MAETKRGGIRTLSGDGVNPSRKLRIQQGWG
jgi:hypothetical protein